MMNVERCKFQFVFLHFILLFAKLQNVMVVQFNSLSI